MGFPHNGILFAREYEFPSVGSTGACYSVNFQGTVPCMEEMSGTGKSIKAGSRRGYEEVKGKGNSKSQAPLGCDLKVLELDSAYNYVTVNTL